MTQNQITSEDADHRRGWWSRRSTWQKWAIVISAPVLLFLIAISFFRQGDDERSLTFGEVILLAREDQVEAIDVYGTRLDVKIRGDDVEFRSRIGRSTDVVAALDRNEVPVGAGGVDLDFHGPSPAANWVGLLIYCGVLGAFLVAMYFVVRNAVHEGLRRRHD
jgi:hypothetical protein